MENVTKRHPAPGTRRCAFTGYRPAKMPFGYDENCAAALEFKRRLKDTVLALILEGYRHFVSGGAMGMDLMAAEAVLDLRGEFPDVTLEMALPYAGQSEKWPESARRRWKKCLDEADMVTVLSETYTKSCFFTRNRYLVQQADILLACYDGQEGGTKMTVEYAKRCGCPVWLLPPVRETRSA